MFAIGGLKNTMEIATGSSKKHNEKEAVADAATQLLSNMEKPSFLFVLSTVAYDNKMILSELNNYFNDVKMIGATSCMGIITQNGYFSSDLHGLGIFGISDKEGCYGVAAVTLRDDPYENGQEVIRKALENAGRPGEIPSMILMTSAPGKEEALMRGILSVVGEQTPIFGGSSADNTIAGEWHQFCCQNIYQNAIVVAAIYTSDTLGYAFLSGYTPTDNEGIVTKASGRIVHTIDNQPAAIVYNKWTNNLFSSLLGTNANILSMSTFHPLGRVVGEIGKIPYYTLSHPNELFPDQSISFFSDLNVNDKVVLMSGTKESLKTRVKRVIHLAKENFLLHNKHEPKGALIVYCAGCFLAIQDEIQDVLNVIHTELPFEPFLGMFSFGEQGCLFGGENQHGNLMISTIIF